MMRFISNRLAKVALTRSESTKSCNKGSSSCPASLFFETRQSGREEIIAIPAIKLRES